MGKNKENLNIFLLHFLERLNSNEPNERKVIESLTDFCNYYDFTKGFIYQTDGFRYFLLKETIGNEGGTMKPRFDMGELKKEHVDAMKARDKPFYGNRNADASWDDIDILDFYGEDSLLIRHFEDTEGKIIGFIGFAGREEETYLTEEELQIIHLLLGSFSKEIAVREYKEREVRASNTLGSIMNNMGVDIYVNSFESHDMLYANRSMAEPYGGIEHFWGKKCWEALYSDKTGECEFCPKRHLIDENGHPTKVYSWDYQRPFDKCWFRVFSAAFAWVDGQMAHVITSVDIDHQKKIEEELRVAKDKAEHLDRLKSAFLANMSHEIRTPLNAIVGFSRLMTIADNAEDEKLYSDIINQNSEILLQLINDILDLAKIEAGTLEYIRYPMDLGELCRNVYEMHKDRVQTGVVLILDNKDTSLIINEDQNRIMQVVTNLITNAIKFTFKGEIRFGFEVREEYIDFYVKDTGMGISEEKIKMIFERFVKLNTFVQGTGLGLAICRVIVEKLGGEITAESKLNEGSTFRFTIPYKAGKKIPESGKAMKCPESGSTGPRKVLQRRTVLVAEDVDSNFLLLKTLLGKRCNLLWAKNGEDAVNQFKEHQPDLILMDIKMPHMDGLEATRLIRSYSKEVPIVALTAFAFESDKDRAIEAGCNDFLTKPVSQNALEKVLDKYVK